MEVQFIYNVHNGLANSIFDLAHKIISPETYQCNLCKITHGAFTETKKFKDLKRKHNITLWHIDEYEKRFRKEHSYPLIVIHDEKNVEIGRITSEEINSLTNVDELEMILDEII